MDKLKRIETQKKQETFLWNSWSTYWQTSHKTEKENIQVANIKNGMNVLQVLQTFKNKNMNHMQLYTYTWQL